MSKRKTWIDSAKDSATKVVSRLGRKRVENRSLLTTCVVVFKHTYHRFWPTFCQLFQGRDLLDVVSNTVVTKLVILLHAWLQGHLHLIVAVTLNPVVNSRAA